MQELISVIIPTYKRKKVMVKRAVESVLAQTYSNLEIIVVDDSPSNYSGRSEIEAMVAEISIKDNRICYVRHEKNLGACAARNTGINHATGRYIAFLDDDDEWLREKLEMQVSLLKDDVALVYCGRYIVNELKKATYVSKHVYYSGKVFEKLLQSNFIGSTSFVLIKKECLDAVGYFNDSMESAQDYELWLRIAQKYSVDYVNKPLVKYYVHPEERITTNYSNKIRGAEKILNIYHEFYTSHSKIKNNKLLDLALYYGKEKNYSRMWELFFNAIALAPLNVYNNLIMFLRLTKVTLYKNG